MEPVASAARWREIAQVLSVIRANYNRRVRYLLHPNRMMTNRATHTEIPVDLIDKPQFSSNFRERSSR